jgi:N utilization substance protein B
MRRRKAREFALQILFAMENQGMSSPNDVQPSINLFLQNFAPQNVQEILDIDFLSRLLRGIFAKLDELDTTLAASSEHWKLNRMTKVDRNVLRIGAHELAAFLDVPPKVTIDECVELAKRYGNEESSAFVNGILDQLLRSSGRDKEA